MKGKLSFKWKFNALLKNGMDDVFGDIFQKGIDQIEKYLVNELESMKITHQGIITKHATNFIQQKDPCSIDDFQLKSKYLNEKTTPYFAADLFHLRYSITLMIFFSMLLQKDS